MSPEQGTEDTRITRGKDSPQMSLFEGRGITGRDRRWSG